MYSTICPILLLLQVVGNVAVFYGLNVTHVSKVELILKCCLLDGLIDGSHMQNYPRESDRQIAISSL